MLFSEINIMAFFENHGVNSAVIDNGYDHIMVHIGYWGERKK